MPSTTARGLEQLPDPFRIEGRRGRLRAPGQETEEELGIEASKSGRSSGERWLVGGGKRGAGYPEGIWCTTTAE